MKHNDVRPPLFAGSPDEKTARANQTRAADVKSGNTELSRRPKYIDDLRYVQPRARRGVLHFRNESGMMIIVASVTEQLRETIRASGMTLSDVADAIGSSKSVLSRFVSSGRGLRTENVDRLCSYFNLKLTPDDAKGGNGAKPARKGGR